MSDAEFRAALKAAQVLTGPRIFRPFAPLVEWWYKTLPSALGVYRRPIIIALILQTVDVALHAYDSFLKH